MAEHSTTIDGYRVDLNTDMDGHETTGIRAISIPANASCITT